LPKMDRFQNATKHDAVRETVSVAGRGLVVFGVVGVSWWR
jgi:hypothetical protein